MTGAYILIYLQFLDLKIPGADLRVYLFHIKLTWLQEGTQGALKEEGYESSLEIRWQREVKIGKGRP